jgi:hypothetical protein
MVQCRVEVQKNKHMEHPQQQLVERIKAANNVLVTVSTNPSVDQLAAAIGFGLLLNKLGKHATAVFSGAVPSTIEFLQPEKTLEKTTDSLRDFIIALDKSKADKLRYKVEDEHVKIFITPYRTSISQADLEFSQGDFNVDVVIALGVHEQTELDQAITAHGRILHDATVISVTKETGNNVGSINWVDTRASSLCEMLASISDAIKPDALDNQISTALLTGIVAETERFSNEKTTSATMAASAKLMAAGANQQLVAEKLQPKPEPLPVPQPAPEAPVAAAPAAIVQPPAAPPEPAKPSDGALHISHDPEPYTEPFEDDEAKKLEQIHIDENGQLLPLSTDGQPPRDPRIVLNGPSLEGRVEDPAEAQEESTDPLSLPPTSGIPLLSHDGNADADKPDDAGQASVNATPADEPNGDNETLADIEKAVRSAHSPEGRSVVPPPASVDAARQAVNTAENTGFNQPLPPIDALNAQPLGAPLQQPAATPPAGDSWTHYAPEPTVVTPQSGPTTPPPITPPPFTPGNSLPPLPGQPGANPPQIPGTGFGAPL